MFDGCQCVPVLVHVGVLPAFGMGAALGSEDDSAAIGQDLVHVHLHVCDLRGIYQVDVGLVDEVRRRHIMAEGQVISLAAVVSVGRDELAPGKSTVTVRVNGEVRVAGRPPLGVAIMFPPPGRARLKLACADGVLGNAIGIRCGRARGAGACDCGA